MLPPPLLLQAAQDASQAAATSSTASQAFWVAVIGAVFAGVALVAGVIINGRVRVIQEQAKAAVAQAQAAKELADVQTQAAREAVKAVDKRVDRLGDRVNDQETNIRQVNRELPPTGGGDRASAVARPPAGPGGSFAGPDTHAEQGTKP